MMHHLQPDQPEEGWEGTTNTLLGESPPDSAKDLHCWGGGARTCLYLLAACRVGECLEWLLLTTWWGAFHSLHYPFASRQLDSGVEMWWGHAFCIIVIYNIHDMLYGSIMSDIVHAEWWEMMGTYQFLPHLHVPILYIMLRLGQLYWVLLCNIQQCGCNDEQCCLICNQRKVTVWKHGTVLGGRAEWEMGQWRKPFIQLYPVTSRLLGDSWANHTYNIWISCDMSSPPASQSTLPWIKGKGPATDRQIKHVVAVDEMGCGWASCIHKTTQKIC